MTREVKSPENDRGKPPTLQVSLPLPPSINSQYATVEGRRVLSETARKWKRQVEQRLELLEEKEILTDQLRRALVRSYLSVFIEFYFASPHRRDLDGGLKITLDAVCEGLGVNDNRVVEIHLVKKIDPLHPHINVTIEGVSDWEFDEQYVLLDDAE
jgi:crossover junction endodeoxyribonuclease RusA